MISLLCAHLLWQDPAQSQLNVGPFGAFTDLPLRIPPSGLAVSPRLKGFAEVFISTLQPPALMTYSLTDSATIAELKRWDLPAGIWLSPHIVVERGGTKRLAGLTEDRSEVLVLGLSNQKQSVTVIKLAEKPERILLTDIDNDRVTDLLAFGKTVSGVTAFRGLRNGRFEPGMLLFPNVSASDVAVTDLNGDGIADVFLLNWLANSLEVYFGISRGIFSEQVEIPLGSEPADLTIEGPSRRRIIRVAVTLPSTDRVAVVTGNGAGEFSPPVFVRFPASPNGVALRAINSDLAPDLITSTADGVLTAFGLQNRGFGSPTATGVIPATTLWNVSDIDGNGKADLLFYSATGRRLIIASNVEGGGKVRWPSSYLVGTGPRGVVITDLNRDGRGDIVVANSQSASISVLPGMGDSRFGGQRVSPVSEDPENLLPFGEASASSGIVISHARAGKISVVRFKPDGFTAGYIAIPTAPDPYALRVTGSGSEGGLRILVRNKRAASSAVSFSLFEQIGGSTFLERSYQTGFPATIRSLTVGNFTGNNGDDILFLTHGKESARTYVAVAPGGGTFSYSRFDTLFSYQDSATATRFVAAEDLNGDGVDDVILSRGGDSPAIGIARSTGNGQFDRDVRWIQGLRVPGRSMLNVLDADGDGLKDIVLFDELGQSILMLAGRGDGQMSAPRRICTVPGAGGFAVGPLTASGMNDLVVTFPQSGGLRVFYDPF